MLDVRCRLTSLHPQDDASGFLGVVNDYSDGSLSIEGELNMGQCRSMCRGICGWHSNALLITNSGACAVRCPCPHAVRRAEEREGFVGHAYRLQRSETAQQLRQMQRSAVIVDNLVLHLLPNAASALAIRSLLRGQGHLKWLRVAGVLLAQAFAFGAVQLLLRFKKARGSWRAVGHAAVAAVTPRPATPYWLGRTSDYLYSADPELRPFVCPIKKDVVVDPVITEHGQVRLSKGELPSKFQD